MRRFITHTILLLLSVVAVNAQTDDDSYNELTSDGSYSRRSSSRDSIDNKDKEIPRGIRMWTVDERFGDIIAAEVDTLSPMFMNTIFTTGLRGEYNTTGNLGAPRINRVFTDRAAGSQFIFTDPYDYFVTPVSAFRFTNTLSPYTNLTYNSAGNRTNGEDHFKALFAVNSGKRLGVGFRIDYIYGRGYYDNQSTSHFNFSLYGSYLGDRYQAHLIFSTNHQKVTESGGITNDEYVTQPEGFDDSYSTSEIPTVLSENWNRNDNQHIFFTQRYSVGFNRKVRMTDEEIEARKFAIESKRQNEALKEKERASKEARAEGREFDEEVFEREREQLTGRPDGDGSGATEDIDTTWMKNEYVPVTSFIHTAQFGNYRRIYQAYDTPDDFYAETYGDIGRFSGDSIYDETKHYRLKNTFAISLLEGFNKWAKAGVKVFATSDLRHFVLPSTDDDGHATTTYNEHSLSIGGQLSKKLGHTLHYDATIEAWLTGEDAGQLYVDASADVNIPLLGDTIRLYASGFFHRSNPSFYYRHYHSKHFWWDNDALDKELHTRIAATLCYPKTGTTLRVAVDEIENYTYFGMSYDIDGDYNRTSNAVTVRQSSASISVLTLSLSQDFRLGPLRWENVLTLQKSSEEDALPVPDFNIYSNLFLRFKIAKVLKCDFGADVRYFTKYYAPDYSAALGQYAVQEGSSRVEVGNYPIVNVYANFHLKRTRFFIMMSHVNAGSGDKTYFLTPHYPLNERIFRFGLSWNFFN